MRLGADVINLSLAGPDDPLLGRLIDTAIERATIVVAAVPDEASDPDSFPSSHPHVIAAESSESIAKIASPYRLRAPGEEIVSTVPADGYAFFSGNSMSAAYIAGIAALIRQRKPGIGADGDCPAAGD
jgi:subtilisin family serine protease